jgi:uncharacterized protein
MVRNNLQVRFEWDPGKAAMNFEKHGVSFDEAIEVFYDQQAVEGIDWNHSTIDEQRFFIIGLSTTRLLYVVYCEPRQLEGDVTVTRIIHARKAQREHSDLYEQAKKQN